MSKKNKEKNKKEANVNNQQATEETTTATQEPTTDTAEDTLQRIEKELEVEKERYLRLFAEFENYKRRTSKERVEMFKTAGQEVMGSLLPVLDDFDRALVELEKSEDDSLFKGITLIHNKLRETLKNKGLTVLEVKTGDAFNADNHEAITQVPAPSDDLKGKIIDVVEKGYVLGDKIIRFPKVVIGQ